MQSPQTHFGTGHLAGRDRSANTDSIAFLGNYPPRQCGIATFTYDICEHYASRYPNRECVALAVTDRDSGYDYPSRVALEIQQDRREDYRQAAHYVNGLKPSVVSLQHEFGIFGGAHGNYVVDFLRECEIPIVTTMHTVIANPVDSQRKVTQEIIEKSSGIIVMAEKALSILREHYNVDSEKVHVISHGIPAVSFPSTEPNKRQLGLEDRSVILTFGLIGQGKGLEHGIRAMRAVAQAHPEALYIILGATHPNLVKFEGERYRESLQALVASLRLEDHVRFVDKYVDLDELTLYLGAADVYLTPYPNEAQITSGTLSYASGCGCPVVSTPYWHARELITDDRGILTPFNDVRRLGNNVKALLEDPDRRQRMRLAALSAGKATHWPEIAHQVENVFATAIQRAKSGPRLRVVAEDSESEMSGKLAFQQFDHLLKMTDGTGIWQHAIYRRPNQRHGYCVDDNARAFLLTGHLQALGKGTEFPWNEFTNPYFTFVMGAYNPSRGRFRNFMSADEEWLEEVGSEDSQARTLWALGVLLELNAFSYIQEPLKALFETAYSAARTFEHPRSWAFALLGLNGYLAATDGTEDAKTLRTDLKDRLARQFTEKGRSRWPWLEDSLTYANAKLPHALLTAAQACDDELSIGLALNSLEWLMEVQTAPNGVFRPVGNRGWYSRSSERGPAQFDQQPIEAHASVSACIAAWRVTGQQSWLSLAENTFQWFLGANDLGIPLYDPSSGGCCDGLQENGVNENQGAESLLAYHLSLVELESARREFFAKRFQVAMPPRQAASKLGMPKSKHALAAYLS